MGLREEDDQTAKTQYWFGGEEGWVVRSRERIGDKDVAVVSAMFSVPRDLTWQSLKKRVPELEAA